MMFARAASRLATRSCTTGVRLASTVAVRTGAPKMTALAAGLAFVGAATVSATTVQRTACDDDDTPLPVYGAPGTNYER